MRRTKRQTEQVDAPSLSTFVRRYEADIIATWERAVRHLPSARDLQRPALIDFIPKLLERIADMTERLAVGDRPRLPSDLAEIHAIERLDEGFDLQQVVMEYTVLRDCIVRLWAEHTAEHVIDAAGVLALDQAIDHSITASLQQYTVARDRTLHMLDRISAAALETRSLDEFLHALLKVLLQTTAAADTATIMLRDGDLLRVRASIGLEEEVAAGWTIPIDEGFSGFVAKSKRAHAIRSAATDPLVQSPTLRAKGIKALLGVPLLEGSELIGIAYFGSLTAHEFSKQDRRMFEAMAHRATSAIRQHMLREQAERHLADLDRTRAALERSLVDQHQARSDAEHSLAVLDTILSASALGIGFLDTELRYVRINDALAAINGVPAWAHINRHVRDIVGDEAASFLEPLLRNVIETRTPAENLAFDAAPPSSPDRVRSFMANYVPVLASDGHVLGVGAVVIEVTEHKQMARELQERELQFRSIADNIPQLAWMTDATGDPIWFNRRWYEFTGSTIEQVKNTGWRAVLHPEHRERVLAKFAHYLASGEAWEDTFPMRAADGRYRWFLSRAVPIADNSGRIERWFGTNTDVTEQRFMHEATNLLSSSLDSREALQQVAELAVPALGDWCAIDLVDGGTAIRVAVAHVDPHKSELALELASCYPPDRDTFSDVLGVLRTGKTAFEPDVSDAMLVESALDAEWLRLMRALGMRSRVVVPLIARDRTLGAITVVSSEPGHRYTALDVDVFEELGRRAGLAIDNARLLEDAQRETRMREEILAVVSHDLKNPLGAVHLAATLLLDSNVDPRTRRHLETIERATNRMDHLIGDLLDMASIQARRLAIERRPESINAIIREVVEINGPMATEKGVAMVCECEIGDAKVLADRERIIQVFGNLIGNALKFSGEGGTITIRARRVGDVVELAVSDTGPGISEAELPHIFEPYWSAKKYAKKGTGLGLFISKGIVEAHRGRIWVESKPGAGATFHFTLPLEP